MSLVDHGRAFAGLDSIVLSLFLEARGNQCPFATSFFFGRRAVASVDPGPYANDITIVASQP